MVFQSPLDCPSKLSPGCCLPRDYKPLAGIRHYYPMNGWESGLWIQILPEFKPFCQHLLSVWSWACYLTSSYQLQYSGYAAVMKTSQNTLAQAKQKVSSHSHNNLKVDLGQACAFVP